MKDEDFLRMLGDIDDKFIEKTSDDLAYWQESQKEFRVAADNSERFSIKAIFAAAGCAAAAVCAVFLVIFKSGGIGISPASSGGAELIISDGISVDLNSESSYEISINAAFAYEDGSDKLKRYDIGDKFGKKATILDAAATYIHADGETRLKKQEICLSVDYVTIYQYGSDGEMSALIGDISALELPSFGDGFSIELFPSREIPENENVISGTVISPYLRITVDHETKTITAQPYDKEWKISMYIHKEDIQ